MKKYVPLTTRQQALVEENMQLVHWTLRRSIDINENVYGMGYDDLFQEGCEALCNAAASYDDQAGVQFSTYAGTVIRNHLLDHCRSLQAKRRSASVISLDDCEENGQTKERLISYDDTERQTDKLCLAQLLEYGRRNYSGAARLGIEAMELKINGYSGADIAELYGVKPNLVGAWISRATEKLRKDATLIAEGGVPFFVKTVQRGDLHYGQSFPQNRMQPDCGLIGSRRFLPHGWKGR